MDKYEDQDDSSTHELNYECIAPETTVYLKHYLVSTYV